MEAPVSSPSHLMAPHTMSVPTSPTLMMMTMMTTIITMTKMGSGAVPRCHVLFKFHRFSYSQIFLAAIACLCVYEVTNLDAMREINPVMR